MQKENPSARLKEVAALFLKLGIIGFGGPAAHIAMMQHEVVERRKWISEQHFLDLVGATNLIPGPNSTEMTMHIGRERAGWKGLMVAGMCFIMPAVLITALFAWLYRQYGQLPQVQPFIYGIQPAIIAIILAAVIPLAKRSLKSTELGVLGVIALVLSLMGVNEIMVMFGAGFLFLAVAALRNQPTLKSGLHGMLPFTFLQVSSASMVSVSTAQLFFIFLKIGAILYGSGYVLFAFLDAELVTRGLLTRSQLVDAIAVGQFTPGPVFSSVTFIGYQIKGWSGAVVSTVAIFLPSFVFVALLNPLVRKMRKSRLFSSFLDAVNVASVAIIVAICYHMGRESITDWRTVLIGILSIVVAFSFRRVNSALIVAGGAGLGYLLSMI